MKRFITLFAVALALPILFSCNKENADGSRPVTLKQGQYFNSYAGTYVSQTFSDVIKDADGQDQQVTSQHVHSNSADGSWNSWDEVVGVKGNITIGYKYNFQSGKYTVTIKDGENVIELKFNNNQPAGEISFEKDGDKDVIKFTPVDEQGNPDTNKEISVEITTKPDSSKPEQVYSNGTWVVNEFIANAKTFSFSRNGLDIYEFVSWGKNTVGVNISDEDLANLDGYKATNIVITDSSIAINFANGKSFGSNLDVNQYNGFRLESLDPNDKLGKYINGTASFTFSGDLCILSIAGSFKESESQNEGTPVTIMLTLKRAN